MKKIELKKYNLDDRDKIKEVFRKNDDTDFTIGLLVDMWQGGLENQAKLRERTKRRLGFYAGQIHGLKEAMKIFMK